MPDIFQQSPEEQLVELGQLLALHDIPHQITDVDGQLPLLSLFVFLDPDASGRDRIIHLSFLPAEEDFVQMRLLQFFFPFPVTLNPSALEALRVFLLEVNTKLPMGHVSMRQDGEIFYRYILPVSRAFLDEDVMGEICALFMQVCLSIYDMVTGVASGEVDLATAMNFLDQI